MCLLHCQKLRKYRFDYIHVGEEFYTTAIQSILCQPYAFEDQFLYKYHNIQNPYQMNDDYEPIYSHKDGGKCVLGFIQYKDHSFWCCNEHILEFSINAKNYARPDDDLVPPFLPFLVSSYSKFYVACDDFCIVSYTKKTYVRGKPKYSVYYRGKVFLMEDEAKTLLFLETPEIFYQEFLEYKPPPKELINYDLEAMKIDFKELTPELLTSALLELHKSRPKHFLFSVTLSASMYLGLYLKLLCKGEDYEIWRCLFKKYQEECDIMFWMIRRFQANINPYIRINDETEEEAHTRLKALQFL